MRASSFPIVALALIIAACAESAPLPSSPDVATPLFGKPVLQSPVSGRFTLPAAGYGLTSDGTAAYVDGVCGVQAKVFYLAPDYLDGNLQIDNPRAKSCGGISRKLTVTYPDNGLVQTNSGNVNIGSMGTVTEAGGPEDRYMIMEIDGSSARCSSLYFTINAGGTRVLVTRTSATQWNISSHVGGSTAACLKPNGQTEIIPGFVLNFDVSLNQ